MGGKVGRDTAWEQCTGTTRESVIPASGFKECRQVDVILSILPPQSNISPEPIMFVLKPNLDVNRSKSSVDLPYKLFLQALLFCSFTLVSGDGIEISFSQKRV